MAKGMRRRGLLGAAGALAAGPAGAQAPAAVLEELQGALSSGNAGDFGRFVAQRAGRVMSLRLTALAVEEREFGVGARRGMLMVRLARPEAMEIVLHGGFRVGEAGGPPGEGNAPPGEGSAPLEGSGFVLDGVFGVRAEGMQGGILVFGLEPLAEAPAGELRAGPVRRIALS
ncbi:hypothetical protein EAH89_25075 [Roseomonas nepalensis]|uniref:Uncharacterized protein n=1 Tax=Muricoccus nepalensis TaxID=1854500 RepID=A0A502FAD5_9PROT|nr:hypothetical protein [Roseomonas nepalensis]TPG46378.1 hypothetical protein EAH89_25075 [Roseomonas nepalensis]